MLLSALITNNPIGTTIYERRFKSQARFERIVIDMYRIVPTGSFLGAGGPEKDQRN